MKALLIIILICALDSAFGQSRIELKKAQLPGYSYQDTLISDVEVWIEFYPDELKRRKMEEEKSERLSLLRERLKKKVRDEISIDSLLLEREQVAAERDSLIDIVNTGIYNASVEAADKINSLISEIDDYSDYLNYLDRELRRVKRRSLVQYFIIAGQIIIIAL